MEIQDVQIAIAGQNIEKALALSGRGYDRRGAQRVGTDEAAALSRFLGCCGRPFQFLLPHHGARVGIDGVDIVRTARDDRQGLVTGGSVYAGDDEGLTEGLHPHGFVVGF